MKLIAASAVSVMLLMAQSDQSARRNVTAVRHWSLKDVTRVAIEVSGPFEYRTDRLHSPERVYFDLLKTRLHIDGRRYHTEAVDDARLQRVRVAETTADTIRVVLDLAGDVDATATTLTNPDRLIIELRNKTPHTEAPPTDPADPPSLSLPPTPAPIPARAVEIPQVPAVKPAAVFVKPAAIRNDIAPPAPLPDPPKLEDAASEAAVAPSAAPARFTAPVLPEETATGAHHTSAGTNSLIRALGLKINRVVIDPGHGGHDQGTEGPKGLLEKDLVLDVALRVGKLVQERMGAEVIYTRSDDTFIPLEGRTALANEKKADLFLSIHANSSPLAHISGVETYYLNINGTRDAMDVAARENGPAQSSIFELQDIVKKIALHDKSEESHEFAKRMEASLYAFSLKNFPGTKDRGVKTAPFIVLIGANMPSILAEIGFVSNPREEALLKRSDYRQKLAEALYKGMEKYTEGLSHFTAAARP